MVDRRLLALLLALSVAAYPVLAKKKKEKKEEITQTLDLPKDPPQTVMAETARLQFHVSPLSAKGLLSQQVRDALKSLLKSAGSASIVKLRAFVAGSGDLRRVQAIVSETFTDKKLPLPALSVVQVGGLPMEGAQVVIEAAALAKKDVNPYGVAFISGQQHRGEKPLEPLAPLASQSVADLEKALAGIGSDSSDVLRVTCFLSSLDDLPRVRGVVEARYPKAALDYVQLQRAPLASLTECEAVARLRQKIDQPARLVNPPGLNASPNYSQVALIAAPRIVLSGTQLSYGYQDSDARLAFQRLDKALQQAGVSMKDVVASSLYPLSNSLSEQVRRVRFDFFDKARPPASTMLIFEGLPAMEAGFAMDVVALGK